MKICTKCKQEKKLSEFYKDKSTKSELTSLCKNCIRLNLKNSYLKYKEKRMLSAKQYRDQNRNMINEKSKKYYQLYPWMRTFYHIKHRCENSNNEWYHRYGGRGIECHITKEELKELWFRDKAYEMDRPSIDRIDNDGNYEYGNCEYIELAENSSKNKLNRIAVLQLDLNENFIKEYKNSQHATKSFGLKRSHIAEVCKGKRKTTLGFKWKYKENK